MLGVWLIVWVVCVCVCGCAAKKERERERSEQKSEREAWCSWWWFALYCVLCWLVLCLFCSTCTAHHTLFACLTCDNDCYINPPPIMIITPPHTHTHIITTTGLLLSACMLRTPPLRRSTAWCQQSWRHQQQHCAIQVGDCVVLGCETLLVCVCVCGLQGRKCFVHSCGMLPAPNKHAKRTKLGHSLPSHSLTL